MHKFTVFNGLSLDSVLLRKAGSVYLRMPILIGLDFGEKRTGIAVTDPMQLIASGLSTLPTAEVIPFLKEYVQQNEVDKCIVG